MNCLPRINNLYILLFGFLIPSAAFAQNGMYFDSDHTFLVPMMADDVLKGHAYIYKLDNVSKDSDSYMMQVFDEHLHDVGEKKIMMPSKATYHAALFNGTDLVVRFNIGKSGVRYLIFNQRAEQIFDTTLNIELRKASKWKETDFQQTPLISVAGQSVLDYVLSSHGGTTLVSVGNDHKVWTHEFRSSQPLQVNFLAANEKYILQSVYHFRKGKYGNDVGTSISFLSSQGVSIAETPVYRNDSVSFYPVAADLGTNGIEVISEFTRRAHEFSKVKYGVSLLHFDLNGKFLDEKANDFTVNLVNDSVFKKYKLLVHSYLYMHKATRLKNGNWLLAAEQFQKTRMKSGLGRNKNIIYNKKNICLMEINDEADIVQIHVEPNKPDGARVPRAYYR
ncbi:MAG TPA: hypothetical protein PLP14_07900, partial [Chitinophagaceae bacterium]|nr:hypothetical protein [Chitinophagaceae bacterium]